LPCEKRQKAEGRRQKVDRNTQFRCSTAYQHLATLTQEINVLEQHRYQLTTTIDDGEVDRQLKEVNLEGIKQKIDRESKELEKLIMRLSRPTLNIGVVGRMGQGKSTFLKSLSGLGNNEIPAREGGACTAVRSKICHHDGDTEATVTLHSEGSFLEEVIGEYYRELNLGTIPISIDAFGNNPLPQSPTGATKEEMYKRLRDDYYLTFAKYRPLLKSGSPRQIPIAQQDIPKYVAQQRDKDQKSLVSFEHLVVREVEIRCRFLQVEVNKLGLLDVPGLGDTRVGDEQLILKTLEQEVDVVLFFRRPDPMRYQWEKQDTELYTIASQALDNLSSRAFMVLNHIKFGTQDNLNGCNALKGDLGSMKVVDCTIADCNNPADANQVLDGVLQYLDRQIVEIEEQSARSCQNRLLEIFNFLNGALHKAQNALLAYVGESRRFESRFDETTHILHQYISSATHPPATKVRANSESHLKDDW
jgi:energy-coupling factor transporter ATP-binding protein EcfA2